MRDTYPRTEASLIHKVGDQLITVDDFLDDFDPIRAELVANDFIDGFNTADGVTYPHLIENVPQRAREQIIESIGEPVELFARMSPSGVIAPHPVHSDTLQSNVTMILYINDGIDEESFGTGIMRHHETGLMQTPINDAEMKIWQDSYQHPHQWETVHFFQGKANRAIFFDSRLMHMAFPYNGFGQTPEDARLIIGGFFA